MNRRVFMASLAALVSSRLLGGSAEAAGNPLVFPVNGTRVSGQFLSFSVTKQTALDWQRFTGNTVDAEDWIKFDEPRRHDGLAGSMTQHRGAWRVNKDFCRPSHPLANH